MAHRTMTDADIAAIVQAFKADHTCRYTIDPDELSEAVRFFRNINDILEDSKRTIRKTFLIIIITGICGLTLLGFWTKLRGA